MGSEKDYFAYLDHLQALADEDVRFVREKDRSYGGSWKRGGGISAWFMLRRKCDRLIAMMTPPDAPEGWPTSVRVNAENTHRLLEMTKRVDVFAQVTARPGGEDGTVLAEVRDLRRYLMLVEAEMVARGVVVLPLRKHRPGNARGRRAPLAAQGGSAVMGAWRDQDGYLVDEDNDDYADPKPRSRRCVCDPSGTEMPGVCPGRDRCPYSGDEPSEEEEQS